MVKIIGATAFAANKNESMKATFLPLYSSVRTKTRLTALIHVGPNLRMVLEISNIPLKGKSQPRFGITQTHVVLPHIPQNKQCEYRQNHIQSPFFVFSNERVQYRHAQQHSRNVPNHRYYPAYVKSRKRHQKQFKPRVKNKVIKDVFVENEIKKRPIKNATATSGYSDFIF